MMNRTWPLIIFTVSFSLMLIQKSHEARLLSRFYKQDRVIKLKNFEDARSLVPKSDLEYLKLWESVLTGRSAPVSQILKEKYKELGLNHVFTPSGFHLSAVLSPLMKLMKRPRSELIILCLIGMTLCLLPGFGALKRMVLIKGHQRIFGRHEGFIIALIMDILWGSFQESTLSFTYSFLFLGIIYSGFDGLFLILYFFTLLITINYKFVSYFSDVNNFLLLSMVVVIIN
jgi:competence protein ComEC